MTMKFKKAVVPSMPSAAPSMNMAGAMGIPRRKMKRFKIDEISFVDKPAQEGALATIEKRRAEKYNQNHDDHGRFSSGGGGGGGGNKTVSARGGGKNPFKPGDRVRMARRPEMRGRVLSDRPPQIANHPEKLHVQWDKPPPEAPWASTGIVHHTSMEHAPGLIGRLMGKAGDKSKPKPKAGDKAKGGKDDSNFKSGAGGAEIAQYNDGRPKGQQFADHIRQFERRQGVDQSSPKEKLSEALMREANGGIANEHPNWNDTAAHHYGFRGHDHVQSFSTLDPQKQNLINRLQGAVGMEKQGLDRIIKMVLINGTDQFLKGAAGNGDVGRAPPLVSALDLSLRTILADTNLTDSDRLVMMRKSTLDFLKVARGELPNLEGYVRKSADPDVERSEATMNLRQLKKKMDVLNTKLDAVLSKRGSEDDELEFEEFDKADDDGDEGDDESLFKAGYKAADDSSEEDPGQIAQRLNAMFGHSAVKARGKKKPPPDMGGGMDDIRAEINAENADQLGGDPSQADMGADDPDADDNMGKKMKTGPRRGHVTTEGEEEDKIAAGSKTPIGGQSTAKRVRLHESMVIGDHVIHKSDVGSDMFEILKAQKEETDRIAKALDDERDTRELLEFAKVAESELPHLPGTTESKARLLKNLAGYLDEDERRLLTSMLKSGDRSAGTAFKTYGATMEKSRSSVDFQKRVSIIKSRDGCSYTEAMQKARKENPDEFEAFQYGGQ